MVMAAKWREETHSESDGIHLKYDTNKWLNIISFLHNILLQKYSSFPLYIMLSDMQIKTNCIKLVATVSEKAYETK